MKKLLIAIRPKDIPMISGALGSDFDVAICTSLTDAKSVLDDSIGLIACGVHFDDGKMFDLLRYAKATPETRSIPFYCVMGGGRVLSPAILKGIKSAAMALGAAGFVDLAGLRRRLGDDQARVMLRNTIRTLLSKPPGT